MSNGDQPAELLLGLKRAAAALRGADIPFMLGGGYAAYARGGSAPQHDVDFFIQEEDADRALDALAASGMRPERPPEDWLVKAYDGEILIDLIYRPGGRNITLDLLQEAEPLEVAAVTVPTISATRLMIFKLLALSAHRCDLAEALPTARSLREQIDWHMVRKETADSPYAFAFLVLLERLDIIEATEQPVVRSNPSTEDYG